MTVRYEVYIEVFCHWVSTFFELELFVHVDKFVVIIW